MVLKHLFCSQETCSTHPNTLIPLASSKIYRLMQRKREQVNREGKNKSDNIKNPKKKEFLKGGGVSYLGEMNDNRHSKGDEQQEVLLCLSVVGHSVR